MSNYCFLKLLSISFLCLVLCSCESTHIPDNNNTTIDINEKKIDLRFNGNQSNIDHSLSGGVTFNGFTKGDTVVVYISVFFANGEPKLFRTYEKKLTIEVDENSNNSFNWVFDIADQRIVGNKAFILICSILFENKVYHSKSFVKIKQVQGMSSK